MDQSHGRRALAARLNAPQEVVLDAPAFARPDAPPGARLFLRFDGLDTPCEVLLNGEAILEARNMFRCHRVEVTGRLQDLNAIEVRCGALDSIPVPKKPRARWRTALAQPAELRWHRTTLLGNMPGWNPPRSIRGVWKPIVLEVVPMAHVAQASVTTSLRAGHGALRVRARIEGCGVSVPSGARLCIDGAAVHLPLVGGRIDAVIAVERPPLWWPHTHGDPALLPWRLEILVGQQWIPVREGRAGFREVTVDREDGDFRLRVNGVPVFCRGSCWAPVDLERIHASREATFEALRQLRDAGANMVRVGGTMAYESDDFHDACDELGLMVWQDFMFANFDYPFADPAFRAEAEAECREQAARIVQHPSTAVWCGGSEVAQQAAMMGLEARHWVDAFFAEALPALLAEAGSDLPYVPSTPFGGPLPFHVSTGVSHYYGVGAYRRPLSDARTARVRFAAECLAFSNLGSIKLGSDPNKKLGSDPIFLSDPGVPRDPGAGWDFADVRDFYLKLLFGVDPVALRSQDLERYLALSRVVTGEVMRRTYAEWRSAGSTCRGALTWLWRDVMPGAGWGVVDADGNPKPAYWFLKRAWAPVAVHLTDEGLDGYGVHVVNDRPTPFRGILRLELLRHGRRVVAARPVEVDLPARGARAFSADALFGYFTDATNAYRFGPAKYDVVAAILEGEDASLLSEDFAFPLGWTLERAPAALFASAHEVAQDRLELTLNAGGFLQAVAIEAEGWEPEDNYFHLRPDEPRRIVLHAKHAGAPAPQLVVSALNSDASVVVAVEASKASRKVNA